MGVSSEAGTQNGEESLLSNCRCTLFLWQNHCQTKFGELHVLNAQLAAPSLMPKLAA